MEVIIHPGHIEFAQVEFGQMDLFVITLMGWLWFRLK